MRISEEPNLYIMEIHSYHIGGFRLLKKEVQNPEVFHTSLYKSWQYHPSYFVRNWYPILKDYLGLHHVLNSSES